MAKQICTRCIYDSSIPYITFDAEGVCNYCRQAEAMEREYPIGREGELRLEQMVDEIKAAGRRKPYDVVVGISGGCDSSFLLHKAKDMGLRPLAAHFDNTWNSTIAVENIRNVTRALNVDLHTHVVDNREFNDIFRSFFYASVPEVDTPSDIGLATTHYLAAAKYGIKYIWEGHSFRTEGISPQGWAYMDAQYIKSVHDQFGTMKMKTFPNLWMWPWLKWIAIDQVKKLRPLYYMTYNKEETKKFLADQFGWQWYGGHHMENRTAYFANNYWFPRKFGIDLRYCEFSALVRSGQKTREEALEEIRTPKPFDMDILAEIKKRLGFSDEEFERIMAAPNKSYRDYRTYKQRFERMKPLFWAMYRSNLVTKSFYMKYTRKYDD